MVKPLRYVFLNPEQKFNSPTSFLTKYPSAPGGSKRSCIINQVCNQMLQVCSSMYGLLQQADIKGLSLNELRERTLSM